jgi:hypothetical protein
MDWVTLCQDRKQWLDVCEYSVICRERPGKETRSKYATSNRVEPLLGNARNTRK